MCILLAKNGIAALSYDPIGQGERSQLLDADGKIGLKLDCKGLIVAPGFIDLHNHSDRPILAPETRGNVNYLMQGCTTVVTGKMIEQARKNGQVVTADQYPYIAGSGSAHRFIPDWARKGGEKAIEARLADPDDAARIRDSIREKLRRRDGSRRKCCIAIWRFAILPMRDYWP